MKAKPGWILDCCGPSPGFRLASNMTLLLCSHVQSEGDLRSEHALDLP